MHFPSGGGLAFVPGGSNLTLGRMLMRYYGPVQAVTGHVPGWVHLRVWEGGLLLGMYRSTVGSIRV